jgi:hypothetical protein
MRRRCPLAVELRDHDGIECFSPQLGLLECAWADIHHNAILPEGYAERMRHHAPCSGSISMICDKETEIEHMDYGAPADCLPATKGAVVRTYTRAI